MRQQRIGQADRLEHPQGLVIQADGAGVVDDLVQLLDQHDAHALQAKDIGDHQPDGAGADDGDVGVQILRTSVCARHLDGVVHVSSLLLVPYWPYWP